MIDVQELERLRARQQRFGELTSQTLLKAELEEQKLQRAQRFGLSK